MNVLLSELEFGSYLTYSPRGNTDLIKQSKNIVHYLKSESSIGNPSKFMSKYITERLARDITKLPFKSFFNEDVALVPVPKSSLMQPNTLWVPEKIAKAMSNQGFGNYYPCLTRIKPVNKASYSLPSERPKAIDHFNSIDCKMLLRKPKEVVLIDDVITRGATMIGCASRLKSIFQDIPIKAFAIIRTISRPEEFEEIEKPCTGLIDHNQNGTFRNP